MTFRVFIHLLVIGSVFTQEMPTKERDDFGGAPGKLSDRVLEENPHWSSLYPEFEETIDSAPPRIADSPNNLMDPNLDLPGILSRLDFTERSLDKCTKAKSQLHSRCELSDQGKTTPDFTYSKRIVMLLTNEMRRGLKTKKLVEGETMEIRLSFTQQQIETLEKSRTSEDLYNIMEYVVLRHSGVFHNGTDDSSFIGYFYFTITDIPMDPLFVIRSCIVTLLIFIVFNLSANRTFNRLLFFEVFLLTFAWTWQSMIENVISRVQMENDVKLCPRTSSWFFWHGESICEKSALDIGKGYVWEVNPGEVLVTMLGKLSGSLIGCFTSEFMGHMATAIRNFLYAQTFYTMIPATMIFILLLLLSAVLCFGARLSIWGINIEKNPSTETFIMPMLRERPRRRDGTRRIGCEGDGLKQIENGVQDPEDGYLTAQE